MMADQSQRVASKHAPADELLAKLRGFFAEHAREIAQLGEAAFEAERDKQSAYEELARARDEEEWATGTLAEWTELLQDFRRGVRDRDELLERTVGK